MIDTLTSTPFFGLGVTLLCWYLAVRFQKWTGLLICNPVLVASLLVIGIMLLFHIPLDNYNAGGSIIKLLLAPATAVLALNIYQQRAILKRNFWPVVLGCFVGSLVSMLLVQVLCRLFQAEASLLNSLLPKSVTTAIAVSIAESSGGLPALTAASVIITGIEGAMLAPLFAKRFRNRVTGAWVATVIVCLLRFCCHFLSGLIIWGTGDPAVPDWLWSLTYNGSFMLPETIISAVVIGLLMKFVKLDA